MCRFIIFYRVMAKKKNRRKPLRPQRLSFPEQEKLMPWLAPLLEGYHVLDRGVAGAIRARVSRGERLACARGCYECCATHKDIPVYPLELKGLIWFAGEEIAGPVRDVLKVQLMQFKKSGACPFLVDGACSVHPLRPMACRQFNVFGTACAAGEDPYFTRRQDVMDPVKKHVDQAFYIMLPFYGVDTEAERRRIVETGAFHQMAKGLHECRWSELAEKMIRIDRGD